MLVSSVTRTGLPGFSHVERPVDSGTEFCEGIESACPQFIHVCDGNYHPEVSPDLRLLAGPDNL